MSDNFATKDSIETRALGAWAALPVFVVAAVMYGSLIPFGLHTDALSLANGFGLFELRWTGANLEDVMTNLLVYIPVGLSIAWTGLRRGRPAWRVVLLATAIGSAVSVGAEALQAGIAERTPSWLDVALNACGTFLGATAVSMVGRKIPSMFMRLGRNLTDRPCTTAALVLVAGLSLLSLAPFDFVFTTPILHQRFLDAAWVGPSGLFLISKLGGALAFAAVGYFLALSKRESNDDRMTAFGGALRDGVVLSAILELMQLFVRSHTFELPVVLLHILSATLGSWLAIFLVDRKTQSAWRSRRRLAMPSMLLAAIIVGQVMILFAIRTDSWPISLDDLGNLSIAALPFEGLWRRPMAQAASDALGVLATFAILGTSLSIALRRASVAFAWPLAALATGLVAATVEVFHAASSAAAIDLTEPLLALVAVSIVAMLDLEIRAATAAIR